MKNTQLISNLPTSTSSKVARKLNKAMISTVIVVALTSNVALASQENTNQKEIETQRAADHLQNENIGFGTGLVIGGILGGPIGAIVAGVTGSFIAQHVNAKDDIEHLEYNLTMQESQFQKSLNANSENYQQKLLNVEQEYQKELLALSQAQVNEETVTDQKVNLEKLLMTLQFKTGSSEIAPHYQEKVSAIAQILNDTPAMLIDLSGYTDLSGEDAVNDALSIARVNSVKTLLMAQGVDEEQITTIAYGANNPIVASEQQKNSFYDRRVVMKLHHKALTSQTAQHNE
ncbi:MAG: sortase-associated OmpA-like protein PdsO [Colwellia sp.]